MKVVHVHRIGGIGGSERHLLTLLPALAAKGLDPVAVVHLVAGADVDVPRADPVALLPGDDDLDTVEAERCGERVEDSLVRARVEQRREQHVARQPTDAVQIGDPRHGLGCAARAMRAAIVPAPKPSSMPTTASPAAQEQSMALSAVRPPSAEP